MVWLSADPQGLELGPNDWPEGCLGYAYNLVRPLIKGHRATVVYALLGSVLVRTWQAELALVSMHWVKSIRLHATICLQSKRVMRLTIA